MITSMRKTIDRSARQQVQRGKQLAEEKKRCQLDGRTWSSYLKENHNISRERADELIRIGQGLLSVEAAREAKKKSQQTSRIKKHRLSSKEIVLDHAAATKAICVRLIDRLNITETSHRDSLEIKEAIKTMVATWEAVLCKIDGTL